MQELQLQAPLRAVRRAVPAAALAALIPVGAALAAGEPEEAPASDPTRALRDRVVRMAPGHRERALRYQYYESVVDFQHRGTQEWVPEPARTYRVIPIDMFLYRRLVSIGGLPLPERQERKEAAREEEFRRKREKYFDPDRGRFRRVIPLEKFIDHYRYRMVGEDTIEGRTAVVLEFEPGEWQGEMFGPLDRIFRNLEGTIWIDREDAQVVLVRGRLREKVRWGFGIVATLNHFELEVEQRRVDGETWLPHRVWYQAEGSAFLFGKYRKQRLSRFHDFEPLDVVQSPEGSGSDSRNRSASSAAMQPVPAAVMAWR